MGAQVPGPAGQHVHALQNVVPSHLADPAHYDFRGLKATGVAHPDGDKAFDHDEFDNTAAGSLPGLQVVRL